MRRFRSAISIKTCFATNVEHSMLQTVTDNKDAAKELRDRSADVFLLIVEHLRQTSPAITSDLEDDALKLQE